MCSPEINTTHTQAAIPYVTCGAVSNKLIRIDLFHNYQHLYITTFKSVSAIVSTLISAAMTSVYGAKVEAYEEEFPLVRDD